MSLREVIDALDDSKVRAFSVPEWEDVQLYLRTLTTGELAALSRHFSTDEKDIGNLARLACAGLCDEAGNRLYKDNEWQKLAAKSFSAIKKIAEAVQEHNGLTEGDIDEAAGN